MIDDMGIFRTNIEVASTINPDVRLMIPDVMVDTMVVFAQPGDFTLLGAIGLEGMNLRIDLARRELSPAGPVPVAAAA